MKYFKSNASETRLETFEGKDYLVVPVIMAKAGVEMNGATISADELHADSWNGVPVTLTHPKENGNDVSANSPKALEQFGVGTIFNAKFEDGSLKAEAWVNIEKANKIDSTLVDRLQAMENIDVSTGYFSDIENNEYKDIKPDHLALLPNDVGACSFNDGCGVRTNGGYISLAEHYQLLRDNNLNNKNKSNMKNKEELIQSLISNGSFTADDKEHLEKMTDTALESLKDNYLKEEKVEEKVEKAESAPVLNEEDKEAIQIARDLRNEKREELITHIVTNSKMCKDKLAEMDTNTLQTIASGLRPEANYSGRVVTNGGSMDEIIKAMTPMPLTDYIINKRKEAN